MSQECTLDSESENEGNIGMAEEGPNVEQGDRDVEGLEESSTQLANATSKLSKPEEKRKRRKARRGKGTETKKSSSL